MFVKIENYWENEPLILNTDNIISIEWGSTDINGHKEYMIMLVNGEHYDLDEQAYTKLCKILTARL